MTLRDLAKTRFRLMVEGRDEVFSVAELMKRHGVGYDDPREGIPFIDDCGGYGGLCAALPTAVRLHQRLGFVIDAEFPIARRWESIRNFLRGAGVIVPDATAAGGARHRRAAPWEHDRSLGDARQ